MATKTFLKNITINNKKSAEKFIQALENAENKKPKIVNFNQKVEEIKDIEQIKKLFNK